MSWALSTYICGGFNGIRTDYWTFSRCYLWSNFNHFLKFEIEKFEPSNIQFVLGNRLASFLVVLFFSILAIVFVLAQMDIQEKFKLFPNVYKTGVLVFGGGHVVLPLLNTDFVPTELLDQEQFFYWLWTSSGNSWTFICFCQLFWNSYALS